MASAPSGVELALEEGDGGLPGGVGEARALAEGIRSFGCRVVELPSPTRLPSSLKQIPTPEGSLNERPSEDRVAQFPD